MLRIRRDDRVMVITGKDKGKTGKVLRVFPAKNTLLVEKINLVKKCQRKTQQNQKGGIVPLEAPLHMSNVMLVEKTSDKPTRFGVSVLKDGTKARVSKNTEETF